MAASSLPEEIVQEILVRLPLDEPEHLARASLVCKAWRRVLSDNSRCFWRRCREVHGAPPPLLGYIQNRYDNSSPMGFVPVPSIASSVISMPAVDCSGWCALDSRHGRVLILDAKAGDPSKRLIVWDPITGSQQHLSMPSASYHQHYPSFCYAGAVLCAKNGCDHLDCHGGPFHVVLVEANRRVGPPFAIATRYSSLTGAWGAPTSNDINHRPSDYILIGGKHNLLIGGALYFAYENCKSIIIKYDMHKHWLYKIDLPLHLHGAIIMEAEDGGLGVAALKDDNCIYLWSRRDVPNNVIGWWPEHRRWVEHRVIKLGTSVPSHAPFQSYKVIGFAEGTNTIFINISAGIFTLDLKSNKVRKIGEREADRVDPILPYMSYYVPRTSWAWARSPWHGVMDAEVLVEVDKILYDCLVALVQRSVWKRDIGQRGGDALATEIKALKCWFWTA